MADFNNQKRRNVRAYDSSHMEIVLRIQQLFEKEKQERRPIKLNNVNERTAAAIRVNENIVYRV